MKKSKYVESFFIQKFASGIYLLLINTTERWMYYHRFSTNTYQIGGDELGDWLKEDLLMEVPEGILPDTHHMVTVSQEKDQISFYFIPYNLVWKDSETIYNSRTDDNV
jgi:hypothetical protein